jgi:hypothetical protein
LASLGTFLALDLSLSEARARLDEVVDVDDEREVFVRTAVIAVRCEGLAEFSSLIVAAPRAFE